MSSRKLRVTSLLLALTAAFTVSVLLAPGAVGATYVATFTVDPTDAIKGQVITNDPLNPAGTKVQVQVTSTTEDPVNGLIVTLGFAEGSATTTQITGNVETTNSDGFADFPSLKIGEPNEPTFTDYQLEAVVSAPIITIGAALAAAPPLSEPFDIWGAGCKGTGNGCSIGLRDGLDTYSASGNAILTASALSGGALSLDCPDQKLIFGSFLFSHATDGSGAVFLTSHITKEDFRAAGTNFGQAHVEWCVGLKSSAPWIHNGASFTQQDTNNDGSLDLYVASAPRCPKKKTASTFAPCILSQMSDGLGGSITKGWLPGGDPPRRT